ncbi:MAG: discoidin domain-containing protein [Clostridia bacterium]|nr:discoidin domain-containing protein [Clostridia bacterium]
MKKTLATLLVVALVASLCGVMFVSAEATNLVAGKTYTISEQFRMSNVTWGYDESFPPSYPDDNYELTDGLLPEPGYSEPGFMAFNQQTPAQAERGYAYVNFDLGAVCDLDELTYVTYKDKTSGIQAPHTVEVYVSNDGENYELAGTKTYEGDEHANMTDLALATEKIALDVSAQYVQVRTISYGWCFLGEIEILGTAAASEGGNDEPAENKTWEDTLVEGEDGNYTCGVPYGYTWTVNYVDGKIGGEDVTVCTTDDAYKACNPNWAITVLLEKQADGTYVAVQDAVVTPGNADKVTVGENQIALVAHSAYSNPNGTNWQGKVVAMSVKAGDVFNVDLEGLTVTAIDPNAPVEPETPDVPTGDAGVLVFVVLAVVAVAGVAVASKAKSAL